MTLPSLAAPAAARRAAARKRLPSLKLRMGVVCVAMLAAVAASWTSSWTDGGGDAALPRGSGRQLQQDGGSEFPADLISQDAKNQGALVVHFLVMLYMFLGLAIVCDEYFVSALEVICERLDISDDVAGATFMAAGGSAPELFTSFLGVFVAKSDVGFGTIVGSAVFNVLFVIGLCAWGAGQALPLDWYPLTRDSAYYTVCLVAIVIAVRDQKIMWYEALILFILYIGYVYMLSKNDAIKAWAKKDRSRGSDSVRRISVASAGSGRASAASGGGGSGGGGGAGAEEAAGGDGAREGADEEEAKDREGATTTTGSSRFVRPKLDRGESMGGSFYRRRDQTGRRRNSILPSAVRKQSIVHGAADLPGLVELREAADDEEAAKDSSGGGSGGSDGSGDDSDGGDTAVTGRASVGGGDGGGDGGDEGEEPSELLAAKEERTKDGAGSRRASAVSTSSTVHSTTAGEGEGDAEGEDGEWAVPVPAKPLERAFYYVSLPLTWVLARTIPDCRETRMKKWYGVTFAVSMVWIALFSYMMVWMASEIGTTLSIPVPVMGVTVLAAGTSIPDALSSLIVAREGHGDMAVSSSIGSNVFDITVGLPVPWLCYMIYAAFTPSARPYVCIQSSTLWISVGTLLAMLLATVLGIHFTGWKLNRTLAVICFLLYIVFVAESLLLELDILFERVITPCS
eukprot:PLAT6755.3.p1 GENE.PLAT6755.3~~PLAT6755.3.p1  ORF type:complete len:684 (+),score=318.07 PLAT6755.3:51-2102(+)